MHPTIVTTTTTCYCDDDFTYHDCRRANERARVAKLVPGDGVHWNGWSDIYAGHVVAVSGRTIWVVEAEAELLNGPDSGEADAMKFTPGGFCGHFSGSQRYAFAPGTGEPVKFTRRGNGDWIRTGTKTGG